jgi:transcriptional regulator with XRE-family HTH domain
MSETIFGDRLYQARMLRQRKLADLAELLECSVPTMSKWEHSRTVDISPSQLSLIAENLRFNPHFFSMRPSPPLADNDLLFKAPKNMLKREVGWLKEFVRLTSELLDWFDERRRLPPVKIRLASRSNVDVGEAARQLRTMLSLPEVAPIDYLTHPAERAGIVIVVRRRSFVDGGPWAASAGDLQLAPDRLEPDINERHEGCSTWVGEFRERPLIVMRGVSTWEKTRWVLAHELGHLSLHAGRMPVSDEAEDEASRFASELIAPIREITKELPRVVTLARLLELKFTWGISLAALIRHLHDNGAITDQRKRTLYAQLYTRRNPETGRSFGATEPGWDRRSPERPRLIAVWAQHIIGTLVPEVISNASGIFPADLLASILNEQRAASSPVREKLSAHHVDGEVIHLRDRYSSLLGD